jgi:hypothetical protein
MRVESNRAEIISQKECGDLFGAVQQAAAALGVSDVEALFGAHFGALTRFANNTIHQNVEGFQSA